MPDMQAARGRRPSRPSEGWSIATLLVGAISYYAFHVMAGILGGLSLPPVLKAIMRLYRPITLPLVDIIVYAGPPILVYTIMAYTWSVASGRRGTKALICFSAGWLIPALTVLGYGEYLEPGDTLKFWAQWPHVVVIQFAPLIGAWLGFRFSAK